MSPVSPYVTKNQTHILKTTGYSYIRRVNLKQDGGLTG